MTTNLVSVLKSATKNPKFVATLYIFLHKKPDFVIITMLHNYV